ncbi:MAG: carboxyl-terminal processing protease [Chloroflexota bacterium]|jgi:carboxyl-terminal processing protease|nr:carboxyl-terminal processing protease [Chloroflexota bacterium]
MTDPTLANSSPPPPARPRSGTVPWLISLALAAVLGALLFGGGYLAGGSGAGSGCAAPDQSFAALCEAYDRLQREYVDDLDSDKLAEGAIRGMFQYGVEDPYSGYMAPEQYRQALGDLAGSFSGIGAEMAIRNTVDAADLAACTELSDTCRLVVVAPLAGSPAERAGLQAGDFVMAVDGVSVDGTTMDDQITQIRGESGTNVTLTLERDEQEPFDVTMTRAEITIQEVESRLVEGHIGYIGLNGFSAPAADQFRTALSGLLGQGADQIVFDLRDNPGGYIDAAQKIASQFIDDGLIFTQESSGDDVKEWPSTGDGVATDPDLPVAVLINGGSASASEIVAAALQESGRATIIGEPSFGKNTVQVWGRLENEGGVRITISRWFTPEHNSVAPDGIQPDIDAARTAETPPEEDPALDAALAFLADQPVAGEQDKPSPSGTPSAGVTLPAVVGVVASRAIC